MRKVFFMLGMNDVRVRLRAPDVQQLRPMNGRRTSVAFKVIIAPKVKSCLRHDPRLKFLVIFFVEECHVAMSIKSQPQFHTVTRTGECAKNILFEKKEIT